MSLLLLLGHADAQQVTPAGVPSGTGVPVGPRITQTGGPATDDWAPRITAALYTRAGALVADLPDSYDRAWQDRHDDPGSGSLAVQNDDPAAALADYGQVVRFSVDGTACFACLVERMRTVLALTDVVAWSAPIAWWRLSDLSDSAGGYTLTQTGGVSFAPGVVGAAAVLDGSAQYLQAVGFTPTFATAWSVEAWVLLDSASGTRSFFAKGSTGNSTDVQLLLDGGKARIMFRNPSGAGVRLTGATALATGAWTHLVGTSDGSAMRLYVDGIEDQSPLALTSAPRDLGDTIRIGADLVAASLVDGMVDEVRVYDRALTADEVQAHYRADLHPEGEMVESTTELSGRGLLAMWEEAVVEPVGGASADILTETVAYNFAHPDYDYSSWPAAVETPFEGMNYPPDWPDPLAHRIWDRDTRFTGVPAGDCYFRTEFTLGADATVEFWAQADDDFEFWLDGAVLLSGSLTEGVTQPANTRVNLAAGVHHVGMFVRNLNSLLGSAIATAFTVDSDGKPTGAVARTDSSWRILAYPAVVPGFTVGRVVRLQFDAARARGALADVTLAFDDFSDSSGVPWDVTADIALQVGDDLLTVLLQLAESYADFHMGVVPVLYAYVSRGTTRAVSFEVGANLSELVHDGSV